MAIKTDTVTINGTQYKHTYSTTGHMLTRNDNKQFVEAYDPTDSSYTYTESTLLALQSLGARLSALETSHNTLQQEHDALEALPHIIETGTSEDGLSWYKLYSDKCCIQWGNTSINECSTRVINLPKTYSNTNYIAVTSQGNLATNGDTEMGIGIQKTATNRITLFCHYINPNMTTACWYTVGYTT